MEKDNATIFTITSKELTAKLNATEIHLLHFIESWLPTITDWSMRELACKNNQDYATGRDAVHMLILHGLLEHAGMDGDGPRVRVPHAACIWLREHGDLIYNIHSMIDPANYEYIGDA